MKHQMVQTALLDGVRNYQDSRTGNT